MVTETFASGAVEFRRMRALFEKAPAPLLAHAVPDLLGIKRSTTRVDPLEDIVLDSRRRARIDDVNYDLRIVYPALQCRHELLEALLLCRFQIFEISQYKRLFANITVHGGQPLQAVHDAHHPVAVFSEIKCRQWDLQQD